MVLNCELVVDKKGDLVVLKCQHVWMKRNILHCVYILDYFQGKTD